MGWITMLQVAATASTTASSTRRRLAYLPEKHTDFIFSVVPEKASIVRLVAVVVLVMVLLYVIRRRRRQSRDEIS